MAGIEVGLFKDKAGTLVNHGASVAWPNIPFSEGGWCEWSPADRKSHYPALVEGDHPFYFAGEYVSNIPGWQEGAVQSAHFAVKQITEKVRRGIGGVTK
jgi:monoamine oxidase